MNKQSNITNDGSQFESYLQTQFFFYLLPCYYTIISLVYRYFKIMQQKPIYYVKNIIGQFWLIHWQKNNSNDTIQQIDLKWITPSPSYIIKIMLSLFNSCLYFLMIVLSLLANPIVFYGSKHKWHSTKFIMRIGLLYFFGFLSWYASILVLKRQFQRGIPQSLWVHRFFWIFSSVFSVTKMFEDYFRPINIIFNILFIIVNVILAIYAIYRPQDNDTLEMSKNQDIPNFIKIFFQNIELNQTIRSLLHIQQPIQHNLIQYSNQEIEGQQQFNQNDLKEIQNSFKQTTVNIKQRLNLLNTLPRRNIFIDKKLKYIKVGNRYRSFYLIITQIDTNRFEVKRQYQQFVHLSQQLSQYFSQKNFTKIIFPKLSQIQKQIPKYLNQQQIILTNNIENTFHRVNILQLWLQKIIENPLFMIKQLLQFLNIDKQHSLPFKTYFEFSYKSQVTKLFLINLYRNNKLILQQKKQKSYLIGYYNKDQEIIQNNQSIINYITNRLDFFVQTTDQMTQQNQYKFWITCIPEGKNKIKWNIIKQQEIIKQLNNRIQQQCKLVVPFYYRIVAQLSQSNHRKKIQAYRIYIEKLLKKSKYYCPSLFQFIRFDPIKLETRLMGTRISISQETDNIQNEANRNSRYLQEYQDKGSFIEILRIDRKYPIENSTDNMYKFKIRRGNLILSEKNTQQLKKLRDKLYILYKGVSNVPEINFKYSHKNQVKIQIEKFLLKVQSLPKIEINYHYLEFYQRSL